MVRACRMLDVMQGTEYPGSHHYDPGGRVDTRTPLRDRPDMDDLKIGPAGETFGQLRERVLSARADFNAALLKGQADDALMERYMAAVDLLKAAYTRVGLPYKAP